MWRQSSLCRAATFVANIFLMLDNAALYDPVFKATTICLKNKTPAIKRANIPLPSAPPIMKYFVEDGIQIISD